MIKRGILIRLSNNRIARVEAPYNEIPHLYIVYYMNKSRSFGYKFEENLLKEIFL